MMAPIMMTATVMTPIVMTAVIVSCLRDNWRAGDDCGKGN
jgi:hypothetical protein